MKEELKKIIDELKELIDDEGLNINDFELLDISVRILNTNQINNKPKFTTNVYPTKPIVNEFKKSIISTSQNPIIDKLVNESPFNSKEEATEKQIYYLKKMGKVIPAGMTKSEASMIIKKLKG